MDLVPRIEGEQVDTDKKSIIELYRVHVNSAEIAQDDKVCRPWKISLFLIQNW